MGGILMFLNLGGGEIVFIVLMIIMLFGAKKIPEIAKGLGKGIREVRNATTEIKSEISGYTTEDETLKRFKERIEKEKQEVNDIAGSIKRNLDV